MHKICIYILVVVYTCPAAASSGVNAEVPGAAAFPSLDNCTVETPDPALERLPGRTALEAAGLTDLPPNGCLSMDVLLVIYTHSFCDTISQAEIEKIQLEVEEAREFYARNSFCWLNVNIADVAIIDRLLMLDQFRLWDNGGYGLPYYEVDSVHSVRIDLYDLGYQDGQFASVVVYYAWESGGGINAAYGGVAWPPSPSFLDYTGFVAIPYNHDVDNSDWLFIHEFHHNVDQMFNASGLPDYPHADYPEIYDYAVFDEGYSFNGWILRSCPSVYWLMMNERWGKLLTFDDLDLDGLPDNDPSLAIDEVRFGSNHQMVDTETDGLSDLEEFSAGYRGSTDPINSDTDGDDIPDPEDVYPLDSVETVLRPVEMVIDGVLDSLSAPYLATFGDDDTQDLTVDLYAGYSNEGLYICFDVVDDSVSFPDVGVWGAKWHDGVWLLLDAELDGYWGHGDDNYAVYVLPEGEPADPVVRVDVTLDDRTLVADTMPNTDLVAAYSLTEKGYCVEMLVRANSLFRISTEVGDSIRMQCYVLDYDEGLGWQYSFSRFQAFTEYLGFEFGSDVTDVDENTSATLPGDYELLTNYPNPFNPLTTIRYNLPRRSHVAIEIYNLLGQKIRSLVNREEPAGSYTITWDGTDFSGKRVATGVYLYRLQAGDFMQTKKMLLLK